MSDNESITIKPGTTWTAKEEILLLLQIVKQYLAKGNSGSVTFKDVALDGRTKRGCQERWESLKKRAMNYDTGNVAAALPKTKAKKSKLSEERVVEDEDEKANEEKLKQKPAKKGISRQVAKMKKVKNVPAKKIVLVESAHSASVEDEVSVTGSVAEPGVKKDVHDKAPNEIDRVRDEIADDTSSGLDAVAPPAKKPKTNPRKRARTPSESEKKDERAKEEDKADAEVNGDIDQEDAGTI